jgi:hypothetical protein
VAKAGPTQPQYARACCFSQSASARVIAMAEALGLAASVITVVDLFIKVGVLCSVYCAGLKTALGEARYILNEADKFTATLKDVERLLAGPNGAKIEASQSVHRGVADCRLQLDDLAAKLEQGTKRKRIMWPLKKKEVADIVMKLERCRAAISLDLQVNQMYVPPSSFELLLKNPPGHCFATFTKRSSWQSCAWSKERPLILTPTPTMPGAILVPGLTSSSRYWHGRPRPTTSVFSGCTAWLGPASPPSLEL